MSNQLELYVFFEDTKKDAPKNHDACEQLQKRNYLGEISGCRDGIVESRHDNGLTFLDNDFFRRITEMPKHDIDIPVSR